MPALTIDALATLLSRTILHPLPSWLLVLVVFLLRTSAPPRLAIIYAALVTVARLLLFVDARLAAGPPRTLDWRNEVVVITGGAGGLGRLIAKTYGARGVRVAVVDVKDEHGSVRGSKGVVGYYRCDVGVRAEVERVRARIEHDLGTPTILVNNAAVVTGKMFLDLSADDIDRSYRVNLLSNYHTVQTFLPGMLSRPGGGTIVTISSVLGYLGCASLSDYTSSKAALTALHKSLREELSLLSKAQRAEPTKGAKPHYSAIRTVLVTPGQIATPLFQAISTPSSFLGPVLQTATVAEAVVAAIDRGRNEEISTPLYARWIAWMGVLPAGLRSVVRGLARLDAAAWEGFERTRRQR